MVGKADGEWQLAFWIITTICGVWMIGITTSVIANDRLRSSEDQRIVEKVDRQYTEIIQRLTRIETSIIK